MPAGDASTFTSTESFYARYRPGYGEEPIEYLVDRFGVDDDSRMLDLGCGAGQVAVPFAEHATEVVGMDPNPEMLRYAEERASEAGVGNLRTVEGSDADLPDLVPELGTFRLVTMGRSFHWMDQERTLDTLHDLLESGGGVAIVTDREWLVRGRADWHAAVYEVASRYLDDLPERETGVVDYDDPWDATLSDHGYADVETRRFEVEREWSVDEVVGYVFSLSYCSPETFRDDADAFEADVRERLADLGGAPFHQTAPVEVISGREPT